MNPLDSQFSLVNLSSKEAATVRKNRVKVMRNSSFGPINTGKVIPTNIEESPKRGRGRPRKEKE